MPVYFCTSKDFLSQILLSYPSTLTAMQLVWIPFKLWQKWWFWNRRTLKYMEDDLQGSHSGKLVGNVGSQVSLTLSPHQFYLTEENLKLFLQFKMYSSEGLGSQIRYWMVWLSPIINYGTPFPNNNLLLSLRSSLRINQHSERRLAKALS